MNYEDGNCLGKGNAAAEDQHDAQDNHSGFQDVADATLITNRHAAHYAMNHKYRGRAIIFNHETFNKLLDLDPRSGTQTDCNSIHSTLKKMGFDVIVYHDLDYQKINETVMEAAMTDYTDCDCFIMVVLSHGDLGILYSYDTSYKPDLLWNPFTADRCPTLAGKPKLFFIQACQGNQYDYGVTMRTETDGHTGPPTNSHRILSEADILICYGTIPGYYSWRNSVMGSWFMQMLCEELQEHGYTYDILTLLTIVNQRVALDFESNPPEMYKQIPCITSTLTRLLRFTNKG